MREASRFTVGKARENAGEGTLLNGIGAVTGIQNQFKTEPGIWLWIAPDREDNLVDLGPRPRNRARD